MSETTKNNGLNLIGAEEQKLFYIVETVGSKEVVKGCVSCDGIVNGNFNCLSLAEGYDIVTLLGMKTGDKTPKVPFFHWEVKRVKINPVTGRTTTTTSDEQVDLPTLMGTLHDINNMTMRAERPCYFTLEHCGENGTFYQFEKHDYFKSTMKLVAPTKKVVKKQPYTFKLTDKQLEFFSAMDVDLSNVSTDKLIKALKELAK